jgi:hypothetical protein
MQIDDFDDDVESWWDAQGEPIEEPAEKTASKADQAKVEKAGEPSDGCCHRRVRAARVLEDVTLEYQRLLSERGKDSLRTPDALEKVNAAQQTAARMRTEINRRQGEVVLQRVLAEQASELAAERAAALSDQARRRDR